MHPDEAAFLEALADNEDDNTTRMIYSDFLDENDRPEEAERMRKWKTSKEWLMDLAYRKGVHPNYGRKIDGEFTDRDDYTPNECYHELLRQLKDNGYLDEYITIVGTDYFRDGMDSEEKEEFWRHVAVVTGEDTTIQASIPFSCSC